jgi:hypothetical protein
MAMPLSALPKAVGLDTSEVAKGEFPHRANKPCNWDKIIPFPDVDQYMIEKWSKKDRKDFIERHAVLKVESGGFFDFRKLLMDYCSADVTVLRKVVLKLRTDFRTLTKIDILDHVTIASACRNFYAVDQMIVNEIAIISPNGYQPNRKNSIEATEWLEYQNSCVVGGDIEHGRNGKEVKVGKYFVDGYDRHRDTVYEYNGCAFHGHPDCTNPDDKAPFSNRTMAQVFEETEKKRCYLEDVRHLEVVTMWSCQWRKERLEGDAKDFLSGCKIRQPMDLKKLFCGGRCNASKLKYECKEGEKAHHLDICSLYPSVNKHEEYPVGHPEIILGGFKDPKEYFGFIHCKVLAPDRDLFPCLPSKMFGKLIFTLCTKCAEEKRQDFCPHTDEERAMVGHWCTPEIHYALDHGYKILEIYEVWHWEERRKGFFAAFVNIFVKIKAEASGWPAGCDTEETKQAYISELFLKEGVTLDWDKIEKNPGLKAIAKMMLNSFWGKFGELINNNLHDGF